MNRDVFSKVEWMMKGQLDRPSNYDRRVVLDAADVYELIDMAKQAREGWAV